MEWWFIKLPATVMSNMAGPFRELSFFNLRGGVEKLGGGGGGQTDQTEIIRSKGESLEFF